ILPQLTELYEKSIDIIYICPYDIAFPDQLFQRQETVLNILPGYRKTKYISDIDNLIQHLNRFPGPINENSGNTIFELGVALENASASIASIIIIFPRGVHTISYTQLEKGDLSRKINQCYDDGFTFKQYFKH